MFPLKGLASIAQRERGQLVSVCRAPRTGRDIETFFRVKKPNETVQGGTSVCLPLTQSSVGPGLSKERSAGLSSCIQKFMTLIDKVNEVTDNNNRLLNS